MSHAATPYVASTSIQLPAPYCPESSLNFDSFWSEYGDYVLSLSDLDDDTAPAAYAEALSQLQRQTSFELWRGMSVANKWADAWLAQGKPVGLFWSTDEGVAESFQGALSVYDERFPGLIKVLRQDKALLFGVAPFSSIDVHATIAAQLTSAEAEVKLKPGAPLSLQKVHLNGQQVLMRSVPACA